MIDIPWAVFAAISVCIAIDASRQFADTVGLPRSYAPCAEIAGCIVGVLVYTVVRPALF